MCAGLALHWRDLPQDLIERYQLAGRCVSPAGDADREIHFLYRHAQALIPAWIDGQLKIVHWGNRDKKESRLPRTGWARMESVREGKWAWLKPQAVEIPAALGLEKGIWFPCPGSGMQGLHVLNEEGESHVYMLTQAASHYYQIMTRHDREPMFLGEQI